MKQKTVLKIAMSGDKSRSKIMKIAVGVSGVESAAIQMEKGQIEVVGDGVDAVELTNLLRKKVGHAEIVSLAAVEAKKEEKKTEVTANPETAMVWPTYAPSNIGYVTPYYNHYDDQQSCTIKCNPIARKSDT